MSEKLLSSLAADRVVDIPLSLIQPDPAQPRRAFDKAALEELAASIKDRGVQQPITVRLDEGKVIIKTGERRFRAAGIAKLETIPCLLDDRKQTLMDRGLDQVAENTGREPLNTMELAEFLVRLRDVEKKPVNEIVEIIGKSGIGDMSRPAISNTMRLVELPEWAKKLIREGALTGSHGKYLLQAPRHAAVQQAIEKSITSQMNWRGRLSVEDVQSAVGDAVAGIGLRLDVNASTWEIEQGHAVRPLFDLAVCKTCEFHSVTNRNGYCFNRAEFDKKQVAAEVAIKKDPGAAPKAVQQQLKAEAARKAQDEKFRSQQAKSSVKTRERNRSGEIAEHFYKKLQLHLARVVLPQRKDRELYLQISAFAGVAQNVETSWNGNPPNSRIDFEPRETAAGAIRREDLSHFLGKKVEEADLLAIAQASVFLMEDEELVMLAQFLKLPADPLFRIDDAYLELMQRSQLDELAKKAKFPTVAGLTGKQLREKLLQPTAVVAIGVPKDLQALLDRKLTKIEAPTEKSAADARKELLGIVDPPAAAKAPANKKGAKK